VPPFIFSFLCAVFRAFVLRGITAHCGFYNGNQLALLV